MSEQKSKNPLQKLKEKFDVKERHRQSNVEALEFARFLKKL